MARYGNTLPSDQWDNGDEYYRSLPALLYRALKTGSGSHVHSTYDTITVYTADASAPAPSPRTAMAAEHYCHVTVELHKLPLLEVHELERTLYDCPH